jgi:hypothetical protein
MAMRHTRPLRLPTRSQHSTVAAAISPTIHPDTRTSPDATAR